MLSAAARCISHCSKHFSFFLLKHFNRQRWQHAATLVLCCCCLPSLPVAAGGNCPGGWRVANGLAFAISSLPSRTLPSRADRRAWPAWPLYLPSRFARTPHARTHAALHFHLSPARIAVRYATPCLRAGGGWAGAGGTLRGCTALLRASCRAAATRRSTCLCSMLPMPSPSHLSPLLYLSSLLFSYNLSVCLPHLYNLTTFTYITLPLHALFVYFCMPSHLLKLLFIYFLSRRTGGGGWRRMGLYLGGAWVGFWGCLLPTEERKRGRKSKTSTV